MIRDISEEFDQLQSNVGSILHTLEGGFTELALTYTDTENNTVTLLSGIDAVELLSHYSDRKFLCMEFGHVDPEDHYIASEFLSRYKSLWDRRKAQFGWLDQMLKRTDYDPLENYDRKEDGGWKDTTDLGARSRTQNLTDSFATYTDTDTETPTVKTKTTETPTVKTKVTETPTVKTKTTETPGVTETTVETPRSSTRTTEAPGVSMTVAESFYGDNSQAAVPSKSTTTSPGSNQTNVTTVEGIAGTDQTQVSRTGTNQTVNEVVSGTNETVSEVVSGNTETTNEVISGNIQTTHLKGAHIDTHNTTFGEQAAQDVLTRLFQNYRVHGNLGVQAVSDMLLREYNLRSRLDLPMLFIKDFIDSVTFYAE